jgi:hypothetical protein
MASDLTFYDAAWPPDPPPETDGVCVYIGGDTVHVWTLEEIRAQKARYRLPVFVRSDPRGIGGVAADVNAALGQLAAIGAPRGTLVAWDLETAADKLYIAGVYSGLAAHGYELIIYGSADDVMGNDNPDGLYFSADWTGSPHLARGSVMTQWVSFSGYDEDLAKPGLPFWDTRPDPPKPPAAAKKEAVKVSTVPIEIQDDSIVVHAVVNGQPWTAVLDSGDAIGPVFNQADASRLGLVQGQPFGVEGAGGASTSYETTASITFDDISYPDEPSAIDGDLQGQSLLGLPFFLAKATVLSFDFTARQLSITPLPAKA